jgi:tellurite resistance protein TehA-like permease
MAVNGSLNNKILSNNQLDFLGLIMVIIVIICLIVCCFCNMISNIYKYLNKCQELEIDKKKK